MYGGDMSTQAVTHRLNEIIFGVNPQAEALLVEMKVEIDNFIDAVYRVSVVSTDESKVLSFQIQFAQPVLKEINKECGNTKWRKIIAEFERECAVRQVCQIRFAQLDSVSAADAHQLETRAQQYFIHMASDDTGDLICQFYSTASVSALGLSVFRVGDILQRTPRVFVVTLTMFTADLDGTSEPSKARTDSVFGPTPTQVCFVVCN